MLILTDLLIAQAIVFVFSFEQGRLSKKMAKSKVLLALGNAAMYIYLLHYPIRIQNYEKWLSKFIEYNWLEYNVIITAIIFASTAIFTWLIAYTKSKKPISGIKTNDNKDRWIKRKSQ